MAGCFGNSFFDRSMERELFMHLNDEDTFYCEKCDKQYDINDDTIEYDEDENSLECPNCNTKHFL